MAEWSLQYEGTSVSFGGDWPYLFNDAPTVGYGEFIASDIQLPQSDGIVFGEDFIGASTVTLPIDVSVPGDEAATRAAVNVLRRAWRADSIRHDPRSVARLVSESGRIAFGRPRRFAVDENEIRNGFARVTADFQCIDDLWYGPQKSQVLASESETVIVGGEAPTPVVRFEVAGAAESPRVRLPSVGSWQWDSTLGAGETLAFTAYPWARAVTVDGGSRPGYVTGDSSTLGIYVHPAYHLVESSGGGTVTMRWREAFVTP